MTNTPSPTLSSSTMRFVLDGEIVEIENPTPTRTVLQYIREDLRRTGTKEGCAEGDCGACTVVLAEITDANRLSYRAVNACIQFLPTLQGKALFTVESLAPSVNDLHPVQQSMVDHHASQCGFCTPGFVMSLYAHYQNEQPTDRKTVDEALSGNLCRCTGYRPILDAAASMHGYTKPTDELARKTIAALGGIAGDLPLAITTRNQTYHAPATIDALATLVETHPKATILAGGTDAGLWVTKKQIHLPHIISLSGVAELKSIDEQAHQLDIGCAVTFSQALPVLQKAYPELQELLTRFASTPIRNAATLGGNVANGSPIGDSMPALLALDTNLVLRKGPQTRTLALSDFYLGYQHNALAEGEFVERIIIPTRRAEQHVATYKLSKRFDQDISAVCAGFSIDLAADGSAENVRIAFGGMAAIPQRGTACEQALTGTRLLQADLDGALEALKQDYSPISDMRASSNYRERAAANLLRRFIHNVKSPGQGGLSQSVYSYGR